MKRTALGWMAAVLCFSAVSGWNQAPRASAARTNLVLITIDTLRPDHLECYGYKLLKTPHINGLASDGVLIEKAYTTIPLTLPAHASLFTGTYPMFHGVRDFVGFTLSPDRKTLAAMLKSAGYRTGGVVGSAVLEARWGLNQGFDFYYDNFSFAVDRDWQPFAERRGDVVVREGLGWLEKNKGGPFFLWMHLFDPHDPYEPPDPYDRLHRQRPYDGEIAFTDENVGRVVAYLKQNNLYEKSLIVLLADHGEGLGEHRETHHGFFIYDSTLRIPMIFKLPGPGAPRGSRLAGPLSIIDVAPTVLQILGLTGKVPATEIQGKGAYTAMLGKPSPGQATPYAEIFLPFYHFDWSPLLSIRRQQYKFIDAPKPELYDTEADPGETRNLHAEQKALASQLKDLLRQATAQYSPRRGTAAGSPKEVDPATIERLQSLGYLALGRDTAPVWQGDKNLPDPKDRIETYQLILDGTRAAQQKDFDRAVRNLTEALRREPRLLVAQVQLAHVFRVAGDLDRAERELHKALELSPNYTLALRRLAEVYLARRRYVEAEAAYQKLLAHSPNDFLSHFNLGGLYVLQERWDAALAAFRKAHALQTGNAKVPTIIGRILLQKGDLAGALQAAQQAVQLDTNLPEAHQLSMEIYRKLGKVVEAEREAQILQRLKK
ncbi:MAG: sulfatase-like hydrolase/transferase [Acidobacteriota bacterium]